MFSEGTFSALHDTQESDESNAGGEGGKRTCIVILVLSTRPHVKPGYYVLIEIV